MVNGSAPSRNQPTSTITITITSAITKNDETVRTTKTAATVAGSSLAWACLSF
jgi:hypothetical protein